MQDPSAPSPAAAAAVAPIGMCLNPAMPTNAVGAEALAVPV